jgi:hypothetical protein
MKKLIFNISINTQAYKVYDLMLGISDKSTYGNWTAIFNPSSTFEGSWEKGSKILFIGTGEEGEIGGMASEIIENIPYSFVSIRHYGLVNDGVIVTDGPDVEKWAGGLENYSFKENMGVTIVSVEVDTTEDFVDYMNETYPKALEKLKEMCEKSII